VSNVIFLSTHLVQMSSIDSRGHLSLRKWHVSQACVSFLPERAGPEAACFMASRSCRRRSGESSLYAMMPRTDQTGASELRRFGVRAPVCGAQFRTKGKPQLCVIGLYIAYNFGFGMGEEQGKRRVQLCICSALCQCQDCLL
jgi:hypothetical protein